MAKKRAKAKPLTAHKRIDRLFARFGEFERRELHAVRTHADLSTRLNNLDDVMRREVGRLQSSHLATNQRLDQMALLVYAPALNGKMQCVICKKSAPECQFTYETENGQLCEQCWNWHATLKASFERQKLAVTDNG